jgi:hypothetical protein
MIIAIGLLCLYACSDCEPVPSTANRVTTQFYRTDSLLVGKKRIAFDRKLTKLSAIGATDTFPSRSTVGLLLVELPSNKDTAFYVYHREKATDTLGLAYTRTMKPLPPDCGAYILFSELSIIYHTFDSVRLLPEGNAVEIFDAP